MRVRISHLAPFLTEKVMTNIVGISALEELRKVPGFEQAIIAGGFCRDSVLGGEVKDLDIFIPVHDAYEFKDIVHKAFPKTETLKTVTYSAKDWAINRLEKVWSLDSSFKSFTVDPVTFSVDVTYMEEEYDTKIGNFKNFQFEEKNSYQKGSLNYVGKYDCSYMGFLDVDIIGYKYKDYKDFEGNPVGSFPEFVINDFDFDICKIYYDGKDTIRTKEFDKDVDNKTMTLSSLRYISELPNAIKRFNRMSEKYPDRNFKFNTTCLEIKKEEENQEKKSTGTYTVTSGTTTNDAFMQIVNHGQRFVRREFEPIQIHNN